MVGPQVSEGVAGGLLVEDGLDVVLIEVIGVARLVGGGSIGKGLDEGCELEEDDDNEGFWISTGATGVLMSVLLNDGAVLVR